MVHGGRIGLIGMLDDRPTRYTTTQPFTYRDTITLLRMIEELKCNLNCLVNVVNKLGELVNGNKDNDDKRFRAMCQKLNELQAQLQDLSDTIGKLEKISLIYNPTVGKHEDSIKVMRDMFRELSVFGARVDQIAGLTAEEAAKHTTLETSVIGNKTIFGNPEPRVTPVGREHS